MRKSALFLSVVIFITSCAIFQKPLATIDQIKGNSNCIEYRNGIDWQEIRRAFGEPDAGDKPKPESELQAYTRGYKDVIIILHTKTEPFMEKGKLRFKEIVEKIEICKRK